MALPRLTVINENQKMLACASRPDRCEGCPAYRKNGGPCHGCNAKKLAECNQSGCFRECNTCIEHRVETPGICVKAPLRNAFFSQVGGMDWQRLEYRIQPKKKIELGCKAVIVARGGGVKSTKDSPYIKELELIAVTVADVWSKKGWFSEDLKGYLRLRPHQKLLLLTTVRDDHLEDLWDAENFGEDYKRVGIDYWMPPNFSAYYNNSHMQNLFVVQRVLYATQVGHPHFAMISPTWNLDVDKWIIPTASVLKQAIFNSQFLVNEELMIRHFTMLNQWNEKLPEHVSFWMNGMATPRYIHNVRKFAPKRDLYFVSANPFRCAGHGKQLFDNGKAEKNPKMSKEDLMYENQRAFIRTVNKYAYGEES